MEFSFKVSSILSIDEESFAFLDGGKMGSRSRTSQTSSYMTTYNTTTKADPSVEAMREILDKLGEASAKVIVYDKPLLIVLRHKGLNNQ